MDFYPSVNCFDFYFAKSASPPDQYNNHKDQSLFNILTLFPICNFILLFQHIALLSFS